MTAASRDVVLTMVSDTYTDAVRRGFYSTADQTIKSLLSSDSVHRLLVADHPRGLRSQLYRRTRGDRPAPRIGKLRGTRPFSLAGGAPTDLVALTRRYRWYEWQLRAAGRRHGLDQPVTITFNLWHAALAPHRDLGRVVFYAQDDEASIPAKAPVRAQSLEAYRRIGRSGMAVVAVSQELLDRISPTGPALVVPNGVDVDLWWDVPAQGTEQSTSGGSFYAGTVDARLDVSAIRQVAEVMPVTIAGPVRDSTTGAELERIAGVRLLGPVSRAEVVALAASSDVCLMAHRRTELTEAMSPLKVFEYLASGAPVVATSLRGARNGVQSDRVVWVEPGGDYATAARRAAALGRMAENERRSIVREMSWRVRHQPVIDLIGSIP